MSITALKADGSTVTYTDRRRWLWSLSLFWPLLPVIGCIMAAQSGHVAWYWSTLIIWYLIVPVVDHLLPPDASNPPPEVVPQLDEDRYYRALACLTVPIHYVTLLYTAYVVGTQDLHWHAILGLALSVGVVNGLAINTGHELGHKKTQLERWLAKVVLAVVGYGHFFIEHNRGHHKDVATPEDPATSKMGQSIYGFACSEIPGAMRRAWASEKTRLERTGRGPWTLDNEVLQPLLITVPLYAGLIAAFGWIMLPFLFLQAFWGWFGILTSANYIEHYGLLRQRLDNGRYEPCQPYHSWNSNHVMSNLILFNLQRHSDHHANPTRRYQSLRAFENLPELPSGYPLMFAMALGSAALVRGDGPQGRGLGPWRPVEDQHAAVDARAPRAPLGRSAHGLTRGTAMRYVCPGCGYVFDTARGDPHEGFPAGTPWSAVPDDWACPDCAVREKSDFEVQPDPAATPPTSA